MRLICDYVFRLVITRFEVLGHATREITKEKGIIRTFTGCGLTKRQIVLKNKLKLMSTIFIMI